MILSHIIAVGLGGALGAISRFALSSMIGINAILIINILGCLAIGCLVSFFALKTSVSQTMSLFLTVGLLGGFTTFSAFSMEAMAMIDGGKYGSALTYIALSVGGGLGAFILGRFLVKLIL